MGWWGCGVLDGDSPLDVLDAVSSRLGLSDDVSFGLYPLASITTEVAAAARPVFEAADLVALRDELAPDDGGDGDWGAEHRAVCTQVIGALAMAVGAPLGELRDEVVAAAEADPGWADEASDERTAAMAELAAAARSYDGTPIKVSGTTLFEKIMGPAPTG